MNDFSLRKVYVHGPGRWPYIKMFLNYREYDVVTSLEESDILVFTGGSDVEPRLYGELPLEYTSFSRERDQDDKKAYNSAGPHRLKLGICRGGQLLNVLNGGRMWQHVDEHAGKKHFVLDHKTGKKFWCTSTHHQMMIPGKSAEIVGTARESKNRYSERQHVSEVVDDDIEILWYPESRSLCFQPHPELYGAEETRQYFFELVDRFWAEAV